MKFQDFFPVQLSEATRNKQLLNSLLEKWRSENPDLDMNQVEEIVYNEFVPKKGGLSAKNAPVLSFLSRYDGNHGHSKFDPEWLPDITKYTYKQITSLLSEYKDDDFVIRDDEVFAGKDRKATPERIEASKNLWYSDNNTIINQDGFRVYFVPDQKDSMKFGYYQQYCAELFSGAQWCVTGRNSSDSRSNLWGSYRPQRTFYFIIDESKLNGKTIEELKADGLTYNRVRDDINLRHYLGALQVVTDDRRGYRITSFLNVGDDPMAWEEVIRIYPQLAEYKDKFNFVQYQADLEQEDRSILNRLTEDENSPFEFKRQERKIKKAYLSRIGNTIHKPESWRSMDEGLRNIYILNTQRNDAADKFQSLEFIKEVQKVGNQWKMLNDRLVQVELPGVSHLFDTALSREFKVGRHNIDNKNIKLYKSLITNKFGIYHGMYGSFLKFDGTVYDPNYELDDTSVWLDDEEKSYIVERYTIGGNITDQTFYCVYSTKYEGEVVYGHFLSYKAFEKLKERLRPSEDDSFSTLDKFDPEGDVDIKEIKKGV
jgi:hypothetical protein